ncbi:MAG: biotin--[acetyl-CoA-carboxylase] ligase [Bacillota bacterium]|nr:biotin--[acetyl-CoA-carboxylase] ligase [Bacillota bacterium]
MREQILAILREQRQISGEELSRRLGVSRVAVGKHIQALRKRGYVIEAAPRSGYRFIAAADILDQAEIGIHLNGAIPWRIEHYARLETTMREARSLALAGAPAFTVVTAEQQTAGQGRLQRQWQNSPGEDICMTLLLRPAFAPSIAQTLTLVAAVATAEAARGCGADIRIKWPNDVLAADGRKLAGIKCEMNADIDSVEWLLVGIGFNVNNTAFAPPIADIACSLRQLCGRPVERARVAAAILDSFGKKYQLLCEQGFAPLREQWLSYAAALGRPVRVSTLGGSLQGVALDIDADGCLLLQTADGVLKITGGDMIVDES